MNVDYRMLGTFCGKAKLSAFAQSHTRVREFLVTPISFSATVNLLVSGNKTTTTKTTLNKTKIAQRLFALHLNLIFPEFIAINSEKQHYFLTNWLRFAGFVQ